MGGHVYDVTLEQLIELDAAGITVNPSPGYGMGLYDDGLYDD